MTPAELLTDAFERIVEGGRAVVDGLDEDQLTHRPGPEANPVAWLVWHLARVQDDHVADVAGRTQVWTEEGFQERFDLPFDESDIGFGHNTEDVARVRPDAGLLTAYLEAVHAQTVAFLADLSEEDLDRVVDERWDPPVTLGARLVSVVNDDAQHLGQAAYVRGLLGA
ncbi:MAG: hypothetical protein JWN22_723 [Nocardioides sp.]|jgi:uncharacterized damage-inducible protein DinB|nr:hypothetical protein [Nocardioides sp.]